MILTDTPGQAFDKVAVDIMGALPMTPKRNQYVLTIQDFFTVAIADVFCKEFICLFGAPRAIITDQERNFLSAVFKIMAKEWNVEELTTTITLSLMGHLEDLIKF